MISYAKYLSNLEGLDSVERKVFAVVPIAEAWTTAQIDGEMYRKGTRPGGSIGGTLGRLVAKGLVDEMPRGKFIKSSVKDKPAKKLEPVTKPPVNHPEPKEAILPTKTSIEKLGALSQRVTVAMNALKDIASDLEVAAIEIDEQARQNDQETQKLQQLKTLLKSLG